MSQKPKSILLPIIVILVLAVTLVGAMYLSQNNANTKRGAYFSGAKLLIKPSTITATVGDEVPVQLWVQTDMISGSTEPAKVSSVDTTFCYDAGFILAGTSTASALTLNTDAFGSFEYIKDQNHCLRLVAVSSGIAPENLKSGMVQVASIKLKAVEVGTRMMVITQADSVVAGYNPTAGATDTTMKIASVENATYTISGGGYTCGTTGNSCTGTCPSGSTCTSMAGSVCGCVGPIATPTINCQGGYYSGEDFGNCNNGNGAYYKRFSCDSPAVANQIFHTVGDTSSQTCYDKNDLVHMAEQICANPTGCAHLTPTVISSGLILKFKMSLLGVHNSAQCATAIKMPLSVIVRAADGTTKTITNWIAQRESYTDANALATYMVSIPLDNFNYYNNLAVFVKDGRHLQVKYGVNGQSAFYNKAGGELSGLTSDYNTTPTFDFTKYPLLAGDVTGVTSGTQDGVVDGLDFSYVKTQSIARTEAAAGGYMLADLNGNCKMESQDLSLLMLSLSEKQGQLY